jgi:hypothetical protein
MPARRASGRLCADRSVAGACKSWHTDARAKGLRKRAAPLTSFSLAGEAHAAGQHICGAGRALRGHDEGCARHLEPPHVDSGNHAVLDERRPQPTSSQALVQGLPAQWRQVICRGLQRMLEAALPAWAAGASAAYGARERRRQEPRRLGGGGVAMCRGLGRQRGGTGRRSATKGCHCSAHGIAWLG